MGYVPSSNNQSRWFWYQKRKEEIDRLRALVSLAVDHEKFRIRSEREAESLATTIRVEKAVDPTLGLYAAHAFSQAGKEEKVLSVLRYMREDLGADLFDVRVLASRGLTDEKTHPPQVPLVPMLTQTGASCVLVELNCHYCLSKHDPGSVTLSGRRSSRGQRIRL